MLNVLDFYTYNELYLLSQCILKIIVEALSR